MIKQWSYVQLKDAELIEKHVIGNEEKVCHEHAVNSRRP